MIDAYALAAVVFVTAFHGLVGFYEYSYLGDRAEFVDGEIGSRVSRDGRVRESASANGGQ